MKKPIRILLIVLCCALSLGILGTTALLLANGHVKGSTKEQILSPEQYEANVKTVPPPGRAATVRSTFSAANP